MGTYNKATGDNFIGQRFGRWVTTKFSHYSIIKTTGAKGASYFHCRCDCGNEKIVCIIALIANQSKSCGCLLREQNIARTKHGLYQHKLMKVWGSIKQRCNNSKNKAYENYGGRGIKMCKQWENSFICFYNWSIKNGWNENLSIDRIKVNKGYYPSNCRYITMNEQKHNTRRNVFLTMNGERLTISQWSDKTNINVHTIFGRIKRGWDTKKVLTTIS